jgi:SAM-dependent methyltransferase
MDITNRFVLDFCQSFAREHPSSPILDFGCGAGDLVAAGLQAGLPISGADIYYGGSQSRSQAEARGLLGGAILEIREHRLPFPDAHFGLIVNNQVMEHVDDLAWALAELDRVLQPGGLVLSLFPSRDVFREGHIGIPFSHWFPKDSRARFYYTWALRSLGLGTWKQEAASTRQWTLDKLRWIDTYTRYRTRAEISAAFGRYFRNESREVDYIRYRLLDRPGRAWIAATLRFPPAAAAARAIFRKLAFLVILSRKDSRKVSP